MAEVQSVDEALQKSLKCVNEILGKEKHDVEDRKRIVVHVHLLYQLCKYQGVQVWADQSLRCPECEETFDFSTELFCEQCTKLKTSCSAACFLRKFGLTPIPFKCFVCQGPVQLNPVALQAIS